MNDQNKLNGRKLHHWSGLDRDLDTVTLATAIAATGELFNQDGMLVRLDQGKLIGITRTALREFIAQHIAAIRLVERGGEWRKEFYAYDFLPKPRVRQPTAAKPLPDAGGTREPDEQVLDRLFRHELLPRVPRVQSE